MSFRLGLIVLTALISLGVLCGCSGETPTAPVAVKEKKPVPKTPVASKEKPPAEKEEEPAYVYDPLGSRDPFEPVFQIGRPVKADAQPLTPLQKYDLDQFKLIGVILGKGSPVAMVVAPDQKSYVLKKGVKIGRNDGVVVGIDKDSVIIEETYFDMSGSEQKSIQKIQLPKREGV